MQILSSGVHPFMRYGWEELQESMQVQKRKVPKVICDPIDVNANRDVAFNLWQTSPNCFLSKWSV